MKLMLLMMIKTVTFMLSYSHNFSSIETPPHLKSVAALPCKIWIFNPITFQHI